MTREQIQNLLADALREKYEILQWIGGGGMAEVFLARHKIHGAKFAVKVLSVDLAQDERIVARFLQEARTAATLAGHPNIVPIFDIGNSNGLHFLIMQYVEGEDLARFLKNHRKLHPNDAAKIICQVADALVWAAAKGVVHRDLKPSNLYLDQNGRIMVLDFGIAKAADVPSQLTFATERLGTTYYMSPEQIRGEQCDARSDLYSLGVVLFELLAGRKPFEGDSYRAIEIAHLESPAPDLRQLDPAMPKELSAIAATLLAKDPSQRYQSPKDLVEDLNRYGAGLAPLGLRPAANNGQGTTRTPISQIDETVVSSASAQKASNSRFLIGAIAILAVFVLAVAVYLLFVRSKYGAGSTSAAQSVQVPDTKLDRLGGRMVLVPGGKFIFGSNDPNSPNGKETLDLPGFYIDQAEVTMANYQRFCQETGRKQPDPDDSAAHPELPVTDVSFEDAEAYATWIGKRLPSEKEWEKAARGTNGLTYPWGNDAWQNPPAKVHPVRAYPKYASPYGAYNMAGNVFEWTNSHYQVNKQYLDDMAENLGTSNFSREWKTIKGGHAGSGPETELFWRTFMRRGYPKDIGSPVIGFRCVTDAK